MLRRELVEMLCNTESPDYLNFLFDGQNFRGYLTESELIAKGYANDWASAITTNAWVSENESYLLNMADLIKTNEYEENLRLYINEGKQWIKKKYGFNSRWSMMQYSKSFYDKFFEYHPEYLIYKI